MQVFQRGTEPQKQCLPLSVAAFTFLSDLWVWAAVAYRQLQGDIARYSRPCFAWSLTQRCPVIHEEPRKVGGHAEEAHVAATKDNFLEMKATLNNSVHYLNGEGAASFT